MNRANRPAAQSALACAKRSCGRFFNHFNGFSRRIYHSRWMAGESILARARLFANCLRGATPLQEERKRERRREFLVTRESYRSLLTTLHLFP